MATFLPTNASQVQQFAMALYGVQVGTNTMAQVQADITQIGGLSKALNSYFALSFGSLTTTEVADLMVANLGLTGVVATDAKTYLVATLNAAPASARGEAVQSALNLIATIPDTDAVYGAAAAAWRAKVAGAASYTGADNVTLAAGAGSVAQVFTLTAGQDMLTGSAGNDTFNAPVVATSDGTLKDSLLSVDQLTGGDGNDTLNVTLNGGAVVVPSLNSIENVVLRITNAASALDLTSSSGVTSLTVANSTLAGGANVVGGVATLGVKNQNKAVSFDKSTATTLALNLDTAGTSTNQIAVELGATVASKATTLNLTTNASNVEVKDTTGTNTVATTVSIAATGANTIKLTDGAGSATALTVTGTGSVDLTGAALTAVKTVTVGDGGVKLSTAGNNASSLVVTTGAGADTLTVTGGNLTTLTSGAGNDKVTLSSAAAATSSVDLGVGDDSLTLGAVPTGGATLNGGDGTDTLAATATTYGAVTALTTAQLAKITNFEVLKITDALADAATFDVSIISGIGSFVAAAGVTGDNTKNATVTNLAAGSSVTLAGDLGATAYTTAATAAAGKLSVAFKTDTSADTLNLVLNANYIENNNSTSTVALVTETVDASKIENLVVTSTGTGVIGTSVADSATSAFLGATGNKADSVTNTLALTDTALVKLTVGGDQAFKFSTAETMTKLATIDASSNTAGVTIDASLSAASSSALSITGTAKADTITSGLGGDTLTGNGGNDTFIFGASSSPIGSGTFDTITDFKANTVGNGTNGAADSTGAVSTATKVNGDILEFVEAGAGTGGVKVGVLNSAADASTYLATNKDANTVVVALDATNSNLYVDNTGDGVSDFYIHLTGVTTLDAAAFHLI